MIEREQKFLLKYMPEGLSEPKEIQQAYLFFPAKKHMRIRIVDNKKGILTIKSSIPGTDDRQEWEYEIPLIDAQEMMELCFHKVTKLRYTYPDETREIVIDVYPDFLMNKKPLQIVEIEYNDIIGEIPDFCGSEISKKLTKLRLKKR